MKGYLLSHSLDGKHLIDYFQYYEEMKEVIEDNKMFFGERYVVHHASEVEDVEVFNEFIG